MWSLIFNTPHTSKTEQSTWSVPALPLFLVGSHSHAADKHRSLHRSSSLLATDMILSNDTRTGDSSDLSHGRAHSSSLSRATASERRWNDGEAASSSSTAAKKGKLASLPGGNKVSSSDMCPITDKA